MNAPVYQPAARAFTASYVQNPPGLTDHELYAGLTGCTQKGPIHDKLFAPLAPNFITHNNWGKDLGLFQQAADQLEADLMIFCGAHIRFPRAGWLDWLVAKYLENGPGFYGAFGFHEPALHIRTTFFFCPTELLRLYPYQISDHHRYAAEHGPDSLTLWTKSKGFPVFMVTWKGCFPPEQFHHVEQQDCLVFDQHTDRLHYQ